MFSSRWPIVGRRRTCSEMRPFRLRPLCSARTRPILVKFVFVEILHILSKLQNFLQDLPRPVAAKVGGQLSEVRACDVTSLGFKLIRGCGVIRHLFLCSQLCDRCVHAELLAPTYARNHDSMTSHGNSCYVYHERR